MLENSMTVKLLTEQYLEFLSITGGCISLSESIHVKIPHFLEIACRGSIMMMRF